METNIKTWLNKYKYIIAIVLFFSIFILIQNHKINKLNDLSQIQVVELATLNDSVKVVKSKNGELTYKVSATEIEKGNLQQSLEIMGYNLKDLKNREIKLKDINHALELKLTSQGTGSTTIHDTIFADNGDTITGGTYNWNNKYLFLTGTIKTKDMSIKYKYETDTKLIDTKQGKSTIVSVYTSDTCAVISNIKPLIIAHKTYIWEKPWITIPIGILIGGFLIK